MNMFFSNLSKGMWVSNVYFQDFYSFIFIPWIYVEWDKLLWRIIKEELNAQELLWKENIILLSDFYKGKLLLL